MASDLARGPFLSPSDTLIPPTSKLPRINHIRDSSLPELRDALSYLRFIYSPAVRGSRQIRRTRGSVTEIGSHPEEPSKTAENPQKLPSNLESDLVLLRADSFERSYAIQWLTTLCRHADVISQGSSPNSFNSPKIQPDALVQDAASLLAICAGTASAGTHTRIMNFGGGASAVDVTLTDIPLENQDYSSVGAQTWGGACVLADNIVAYPEEFGLYPENRRDTFRVLELGAGTGLVSLVLGKLLESEHRSHETNIIATDFYPLVLSNLANNIAANFPGQPTPRLSIQPHFLDWSQFSSQTEEPPSPFNESFDLIVGADIIYEAQHATWIKRCVEKLLRKPGAEAPSSQVHHWNQCIYYLPHFHLVIPLRPTHTFESSTIEQVFPMLATVQSRNQLVILTKESIFCDANGDGKGEVEYAYYVIGWS
ncbi:hypothetical protein JAAARDRAFT_133994 [Jaapia argillacea MUCL 33604]|uniref:Uncharacterized protein n=1 Tax=Jaapia argillacea MUCL 33604 TaxID=933084 RepID=A0A067PKE4_9AGAM|nr:hypothetical protein JAAARDRAFT_133994 [Jaapia argillacea MUCL 33604]